MDRYKFFKDVRAVNAGDQDELDQRLEIDKERLRRRQEAMSAAEKLERIRKMREQGMNPDGSRFQEGGMVMDDLQAAMMGQTQLPQVPTVPVSEEDVIEANNAQINEEAKSPFMQTKPERVEDTLIQEASKTPAGQAVVDAVQKPEFDAKQKLLDNIKKYEERLNAPKKEYGVMDALPDILSGLYNIGVRANPTGLSEMKMPNSIQSAKAQEEAERQKDLGGLKNLQDMYSKYMELQKKSGGQLTAKDLAEIEYKKAQTEKLKKEASKEEPTWEEKEKAKFDYKQKLADKKERNKALKETETAISNVDDQVAKIRRAKQLLADLVQNSNIADTGPLDQFVAGTTKEGQQLRQAFNDLSLEKMTKMFAGMSKAIDSDAERKMFEQSQASLSNYPDVNMKILDDMEKAALSLKNKNSKFMNELQSVDSEKKSNEVKRKTKDGKIAIFDADTKQFLRYE